MGVTSPFDVSAKNPRSTMQRGGPRPRKEENTLKLIPARFS